jgi:hypothetical protein
MNPKKMTKAARLAQNSYKQQGQRCYNPRNNRYQYSGAKGIQVKYSKRDFMGWFIYHYNKKAWKFPATGRIDHSKHYEFGNIEMVERSDNTKERHARCGHPYERVKIVAVGPSNIQLWFYNSGEAARVCGVPKSLLDLHLSGKMESPIPQFVFRYI